MSIQRYTMTVGCMAYCYGGTARLEEVDGRWDPEPDELVTYADHLAAVAAAEQRVLDESKHREQSGKVWADGYRQGFADALDKGREALELLPVDLVDVRFDPSDERRYVQAVRLTTALAAIDGVTP